MSTFLSAYTINLTDPVETGRTKINYLISGDTSPFSIWSGTPETQKFLSVYRKLFPIYTNNSNYISYRKDAYSGVSNFNFIPNGEDNLIDIASATTNFYGSYNFVNGLSNSIDNYSSNFKTSNNLILGTGNTISLSNNNFISGKENSIYSLGGKNNILSSEKSFIYDIFSLNKFNSIISSYNSNIGQSSYIYSYSFAYNFISGKNNSILNTYGDSNSITGFNFIGNGYNNKIIRSEVNYNDSNFAAIINGQNNYIDKKEEHRNSILFGSNLTSVTSGYSHFENIHTEQNLLSTNCTFFAPNNTALNSQTAITLDVNYSFHEIFWGVGAGDLAIKIPYPNVDLQFLFLSIFTAKQINNLYFVDINDNSLNFSTKTTVSPTQIAGKFGNLSNYNPSTNIGNRMITSVNVGDSIAYFFVWTKEINKWVMFIADPFNGF